MAPQMLSATPQRMRSICNLECCLAQTKLLFAQSCCLQSSTLLLTLLQGRGLCLPREPILLQKLLEAPLVIHARVITAIAAHYNTQLHMEATAVVDMLLGAGCRSSVALHMSPNTYLTVCMTFVAAPVAVALQFAKCRGP